MRFELRIDLSLMAYRRFSMANWRFRCRILLIAVSQMSRREALERGVVS